MPEEIRSRFIREIEENELLVVKTQHTKLDALGYQAGTVVFDMDENESHGTQKAFYLAGPIVDVINQGKVLIIDEMEARLHPLVTRATNPVG